MHDAGPLLVASDIDGTLLDSRDRVRPRVCAAIGRMIRVGVPLVLATGRPARWMTPVLDQLPVRPMCVCANGAVTWDSYRDVITGFRGLEPEAQRTAVDLAREALAGRGGVGVAAERPGRTSVDPPEELFVVSRDYDHAWDPLGHDLVDEDEVMSAPATKLLLRNAEMTSAEMLAAVAPAIPPELAHVTYSVPEGLLELSAPGVTKRRGLEEMAELIGADASRVVCFGDMPNDVEMLRWAGLGVAMGKARPEVKAAADEVTATNDDDGVAVVLERWF